MENRFKTPNLETLQRWFSPARMGRYADAPDAAALYEWDMRLQKAFLEDIAHVEVLLRNFISERLAADCEREEGERAWYDHPKRYGMNEGTCASIAKAKSRLAHEGKAVTYNRVVAALTFDTWRFLLVRRQEPTVWRALRDRRNGGMPNYPGTSRAEFEKRVAVIYALRNRCSHQEHLVRDDAREESRVLDGYADAIDWIARKIDPEAADWIHVNSRVDSMRRRRPSRTEALPSDEKVPAVAFRPADLDDVGTIARLVRETIDSVYPRYYPDDVVDAFVRLHGIDAIAADVATGKVAVAEAAGEIVGTGTVDGRHISRLFVAAGFQGRGVGSALLDRLEGEVARSNDVAVVESSLPACSLYERRAIAPSLTARGRFHPAQLSRRSSCGKLWRRPCSPRPALVQPGAGVCCSAAQLSRRSA